MRRADTPVKRYPDRKRQMSTVERLKEILATGSFNWERDQITLVDALSIIQSLQAGRIAAYKREQALKSQLAAKVAA